MEGASRKLLSLGSNSMKPRICFLDIDGPIINAGCFGICKDASEMRSIMSTSAIGFLNLLCDETGAKIVTNSSHSYHDVAGRTLKEDLIRWNLKRVHFHDNWRTTFGVEGVGGNERMRAINTWLKNNGEHDWICFDDVRFIEGGRLVHVSFDDGITHLDMVAAFEILTGVEHPSMMLARA
jgi:hypothetical protein